METQTNINKGGEFLVKPIAPESITIPEEFTEEQRMIKDMCKEFLDNEILPNLDRIDSLEEGLMPSLLEKAGELGLLATSIPEEFGGYGKDFITSLLITEMVGGGNSFAVAMSAHTGIGMLPILYFGTEDQKKQYLPKLCTGELKASYCLTEPESGSDALAAKTKAIKSDDGKHYILNGQKMWITNAGFADVFIVFAQVDGDKFTGFIVERDNEGLSVGHEEKKMGIKGSSTRQVFLTDCKVPAENVLGEIGQGHKIAFNILNIGRIKLAAAAIGAAKRTSSLSISYANERVQFKTPIAQFGAIKHKLAEQAIKIYAVESAMYRASGDIALTEQNLKGEGKSFSEALLGAAEEYAVECAIMKVTGSEALDYVVDEGVQVYGGYGFSADFPMDRAYRDSRINRIFEGTNEINRMLTVDMLFKRTMKGRIDLMGPAKEIQNELMSIPDFGNGEESLFAEQEKAVKNLKKAALMIAGAAGQKYGDKLAQEQEILLYTADMIMDAYVAESVLLRTQKLISLKGENQVQGQIDMTKTFIHDICDKVYTNGKYAIHAMAEGDELRMMHTGLKRFTKIEPMNTKETRRSIADRLIKANEYAF